MDKVREQHIAKMENLQYRLDHEELSCSQFLVLKQQYYELAKQLDIYDEKVAKTYGEETIEDIISELNDLHRQEQILLNRLDYRLKNMKGENIYGKEQF